MRYLAALKAYSFKNISVPDQKMTRSEIIERLSKLAEQIKQCPSFMCVDQIAKLLSLDSDILRQIITRHLLLLRNYYLVPIAAKPKAAADFINIKLRDDPLVFISLILALLRFSGAATDLLNICKYRLAHKSNGGLVKIILPNQVRAEQPILRHIIQSPIDMHPDLLLFLVVNYAIDDCYSGRIKASAIEILLCELMTRSSDGQI